MIRSVWVAFVTLVATLWKGPIMVIAGFLGSKNQRLYDWGGRSWSQWILAASGVTVKVEGAEHIDPTSPQVLIGNHQSWYDVFATAASVPKTFHFVAKEELGRIPLFGRAWKSAGHISIDRSDRARAIASLDRAGRQLKEEKSAVVIFPEGTRSPDGRLHRGRTGLGWLALASGAPVVPVALSGTQHILAPGRRIPRFNRVGIRFGPPVDLSAWEGRQGRVRARRAATDAVMAAIRNLSGQVMADTYAPVAR